MAAAVGIASKFEAASLRFTSGPYVLEVARVVVQGLSEAELTGVKIHGPVALPARPPGDAWTLEPLAGLEGTIRSEIVDAALAFDADVTVPIRSGRIRFNDATVEHVGPDSRMGVSRMGLYVDAPNGRSYLYQFPSTPVEGIEYEKRRAMLGPFVSERGSLALQPFVESLLRQGVLGAGAGISAQSKLLFERSSLAGDLQPGDGTVAALGVRAEVTGRSQGRNAVRLSSDSVGRGVTAQVQALSLENVEGELVGMKVACEKLAASLTLRLFVERGQLQFLLEVPTAKVTGLRRDSFTSAAAPPPAAAPAAARSPAGSPPPTASPA